MTVAERKAHREVIQHRAKGWQAVFERFERACNERGNTAGAETARKIVEQAQALQAVRP
jgi:hypothetical protein